MSSRAGKHKRQSLPVASIRYGLKTLVSSHVRLKMESASRESTETETGDGRPKNRKHSPSGSVKRARERAAAGLPTEHPEMPPYPTPLSIKSPRRSPPKEISPIDRSQHSQYPSQAINQPPGLQRGLPPSLKPPPQSSSAYHGPHNQHAGKGPPQRPARPNMAPPMLQTSNLRDIQPTPLQLQRPSNQESPQRNYWEDGGESAGSSRPLTTSSYGSSTGSIPDFPSTPSIPVPPVPAFQPPPRRNLGPPPSARKGGSSYYSQTSFVPPIPEEMSDAHSSYASSHVIPGVSWGDGPPEYYMGSGIDEEEETSTVGGNSGRTSSAGDHDERSDLVRKGSKGRPKITSLETVESGDESDMGERRMRELDWQAKQDERWRPGFAAGGPSTDPIGRHNFRNNGRLQQPYSGYESDANFLDSPRSSSPMPPLGANSLYFGDPSPTGSPIDPRVNQILGHLEKGGALASSGTASPEPAINERGFKRPPRLNLDASAQGMGRGSATSLPELIRRATKLASNLDRGKTASRIGMLDLLNAKDKEAKERAGKGSGSGSLSDILAAFPTPSPTTPTTHRPSGWPSPSPHGKSGLSRTQTIQYGSSSVRSHPPQSRRCCGLPVWAFMLLLIILLLLIAAAVIIPITLIVLPRQHKNNAPDLASCQQNNPCGHGGTSVVSGDLCRCVCSNGFTGATCNTPADTGCTATDIPVTGSSATYKNATMGDSIPRILTAGQTNYSIPLASTTILSLFSATNLTCSSENALVTFNGQSQRRDSPIPLILEEVLLLPTKTHNHHSPLLHARDTAAAQTSNSIIFAAPSSDVPNSAPAATTSTPSSNGDIKPITQPVLDFARTAVLFIFQESSSLETATLALNRLQATLSGGKSFDASQTSAGGNITVDLSALTVGFGNGTLYGGKGT